MTNKKKVKINKMLQEETDSADIEHKILKRIDHKHYNTKTMDLIIKLQDIAMEVAYQEGLKEGMENIKQPAAKLATC